MPARVQRFFDLGMTVTVFLWGFNYVALKIAYREMAVPTMSLTRFLLTWAAMALVCLARRESLRYPKGDALRLLLLGFLGNGVYMVLFLEGMARTSAAEGAIIVNSAPVFTILAAALYGYERMHAATAVGAVVALAGVAMVALGGKASVDGDLVGGALILAAAVVWGWCAILTRPLVERYAPFRVLTLSMAGAAVVIVPYGFSATVAAPWGHYSTATYLATCHVGLLSGAVGFSLFYAGIRRVGPIGAILYQYAVPIAAAVFAWMLLGDKLGWIQLGGTLVVFAGVGLATWGRQGRAAAKEAVQHGK